MLAGTYGVVKTTVVPTTENKISSMFEVADTVDLSGEGGVTIPNSAVEIKRNGVIPEGGTYTKADGTVLSAGENFPETPADGDTYEEGDYKYTYNKGVNYGTEWSVALNLNVTDKTKTTYGEILSEIARKPITHMSLTFQDCTSLTTAPTIPSSVTFMFATFENCTSLTTAPTIPENVTIMRGTFNGCTSLTTAPVIPNSVTDMLITFNGCTSLTGTITINANPSNYTYCFADTVKPIILTGSSSTLSELADTANNGNVTVG